MQSVTLKSIQNEYQQWRSTKTHQRTRIPEELKHKTISLLKTCSPREVAKATGLTSTKLKAWIGKKPQNKATATNPVEFVPLSAESVITEVITHNLTLQATQANGNHWHLRGDVSASQLTAFINAVGALSGGTQ